MVDVWSKGGTCTFLACVDSLGTYFFLLAWKEDYEVVPKNVMK